MRMKMNLWMLGIAAMLASCSSEDLLQGTNADSDVVHITAQLADGMKTRAAVGEDPNESTGVDRYVLNAYEVGADGQVSDQKANVTIVNLGSGNFTAKLDRKKTYKFYCWADEGEESSYTIGADDDLSSITLKENKKPTIAHRGVSDVVNGANDATVTIQMTHAVAKAVLQTTSPLSVANTAKLSTKTYKMYNAITGEVSGENTDIEVTNGAEVTGASKENPVEVLQFYTLIGKKETLPATISYTTKAGDFSDSYTHEFSNAPFQADYRTVFKGDIAGLQYSNASVTATLDGDWEDGYLQTYGAGVDKENHSITTLKAGEIASNTDWIETAINGGYKLTITGPMNDGDIWAISYYLKQDIGTKIHLDLTDAELTTIPSMVFYGDYETDGTMVESPIDERVKSLGQLSLPTSLTYIGSMAFRNCTSFTIDNWDKLTSLETIEDRAFYESELNGNITLPESITTIGEQAFYNTKLTSIVFPSRITDIKDFMFRNSLNLMKIVFKGDVKSLGRRVFEGCNALNEIDFSACTSVPTCGESPFYGIDVANITLKVKASLVDTFKKDQIFARFNVVAAE